VLFIAFVDKYLASTKTPYTTAWDVQHPATTPKGLGDVKAALSAIEFAAASVKKQYGSEDVAWGVVHRYRFPGGIDIPAAGASGIYGVYRVQRFQDESDKKQAASPGKGFGDAWVISVEFSQPVKAWSVLAYGESEDPKSKHCCDQIGVFAKDQLRPIWFTESDIRAHLEREYKP
jgi:acyl-homoserine-lactone acylase